MNYKSKCCGASLRTEEICSTCLCPCEVEAVIDSPDGEIVGTCICGKCPKVPEYTKEEILEAIEDKKLCLLCEKYYTIEMFKKHLKKCEEKFKKERNIK